MAHLGTRVLGAHLSAPRAGVLETCIVGVYACAYVLRHLHSFVSNDRGPLLAESDLQVISSTRTRDAGDQIV